MFMEIERDNGNFAYLLHFTELRSVYCSGDVCFFSSIFCSWFDKTFLREKIRKSELYFEVKNMIYSTFPWLCHEVPTAFQNL